MRLAERARTLSESATLRVTRKTAELRAAGREVISFGAGEPDFPSPPVAIEAARRALAEGFTRYTAAAGIPELRQALAARYGERWGAPWTADETLISVGAKAALFQLMMLLLEDGGELVLHMPAWVSFEAQARFAGGQVVSAETSVDDRYAIHADTLIAAMGPRTRAVLVNTPCNPTGGVMSAGQLERLATACAERRVVLIADETYERFVYDRAAASSAAALAARFPETVTVVGSFSKTYAMTGWRVGYVLGPRALITKLGALQSHVTSNPTSFAMRGALAALSGAEDDVRRMIEAFSLRRDLVVDRLAAMPGVRVKPPAGAFYVLPDISALFGRRIDGSVALAEYLLETAGVAVVPGIAFGSDHHIRLSFASAEAELETGLARMASALATLGP